MVTNGSHTGCRGNPLLPLLDCPHAPARGHLPQQQHQQQQHQSISGQVTVKVEPVDIEEDAWVFEQVTGQKAERGAEGGAEGGAGGGLDTSVAVSGSAKKKTPKKPRTKTPKRKGTKKPKGAADEASDSAVEAGGSTTSSPSPRRSARRVIGQIFMPAFFKKHVGKKSDSD